MGRYRAPASRLAQRADYMHSSERRFSSKHTTSDNTAPFHATALFQALSSQVGRHTLPYQAMYYQAPCPFPRARLTRSQELDSIEYNIN